MHVRLPGFALVLVAAPSLALASKYTGPRSAEVYARVVRALASAAEVPAAYGPSGTAWRLAGGGRVVEAEVLEVLSYDGNGWPRPKQLPPLVYVAVPRAAAVGQVLLVRIDFAPAGGKSPGPVSATTTFLSNNGYPPNPPLLQKIAALPELGALARRRDDRSFEEALHDLKAEYQRKNRPYRMETLVSGDSIACVTGEHVVQRQQILVERAPWSVATTEAELHDIRFHGKRLSRAQEAQLSEILK